MNYPQEFAEPDAVPPPPEQSPTWCWTHGCESTDCPTEGENTNG